MVPVINPNFTTFHILEVARERRDQSGIRGHVSIQAQGTISNRWALSLVPSYFPWYTCLSPQNSEVGFLWLRNNWVIGSQRVSSTPPHPPTHPWQTYPGLASSKSSYVAKLLPLFFHQNSHFFSTVALNWGLILHPRLYLSMSGDMFHDSNGRLAISFG